VRKTIARESIEYYLIFIHKFSSLMSVFVIEIHSVKIICLKNLMDCTRTRTRSLKLEESPAFPAAGVLRMISNEVRWKKIF
jgi:hypothetical protein